MPGDHVELVADGGGRIAAFVDALARFPHEPAWALVGGFAVNVRIERVHRLTNDIDTVARDQTRLVELLVAEPDADRLDAAKLRFTAGDLPVDIDVMADTEGLPLPIEIGERIFALARRAVLPRAQLTELVVVDGRTTIARATVPVASSAGLVLLKTVAIPRRSAGNNPHKVGSDIHDLIRLVDGQDLVALATEIRATGDELSNWIGSTLVKWFSPDHDLRYTYARLRRLSRSSDTDGLTEADLAVAALLGEMLLEDQDERRRHAERPTNDSRKRRG